MIFKNDIFGIVTMGVGELNNAVLTRSLLDKPIQDLEALILEKFGQIDECVDIDGPKRSLKHNLRKYPDVIERLHHHVGVIAPHPIIHPPLDLWRKASYVLGGGATGALGASIAFAPAMPIIAVLGGVASGVAGLLAVAFFQDPEGAGYHWPRSDVIIPPMTEFDFPAALAHESAHHIMLHGRDKERGTRILRQCRGITEGFARTCEVAVAASYGPEYAFGAQRRQLAELDTAYRWRVHSTGRHVPFVDIEPLDEYHAALRYNLDLSGAIDAYSLGTTYVTLRLRTEGPDLYRHLLT